MPVLEKSWESRLRKWALKNDWDCQKVSFAEKGWPDRLFTHKRVKRLQVWMELKREGKEPYDLQYKRLNFLTDMGYLVTWTDNYDDAVAYLESAAVVATTLSSGRSQEAIVAGLPRTLLGSWPRENEFGPRSNKDIESEGSNF